MLRLDVDPERELMDLGVEIRRKDRGTNGIEARCDCPFCPARAADVRAADPAFSVNLSSGAWHCHRCGEKGNLYQLRKRLRGEPYRAERAAQTVRPTAPTAQTAHPAGRTIDAAHLERLTTALWASEPALRYLREVRRFNDATIKAFGLGFAPSRGSAGAIAIPCMAAGKCAGIKYRFLPPGDTPQRYDREPGCIHPLFNQDTLDGEYRAVIISEGELDAIALTQYGLAIPVVSVPDGATATLKDDAAQALEHFDEIFLALDQDEKGDEGAAKLAERLGAFRCRRVRLPHKDANECLVAGVTREVMLAALEAASPVGTSAVKHISAWRETLLLPHRKESRGLATGWRGLDNLLGGFRPGEVTLLTAGTGEGKSAWTLDLARRQAVNAHAVLVVSLEMPTGVVAQKLLSSIAGALWINLDPETSERAVDRLCALPIFLLDRYGARAITQIREEVEYAVRRYGVVVVVLDHLHFALGVRKAHEDERLLIDEAAHMIQSMALELGVHVVLVMHPAKIRADDTGVTRQPGIGDLKGSSGPAQFADNVARIARLPGERSVLTLLKVRSELGKLGNVAYKFDIEALTFTELDSHVANAPKQRDGRMAAANDGGD